MRVPDEILERCRTDTAFRTVVCRQMVKAIEDARMVADALSRDLARINEACVAQDVARSAT